MSLVGTRPILQEELRQYELHHRARIAIKPGITGMWQVSGRSDITDFEEECYGDMVQGVQREYVLQKIVFLSLCDFPYSVPNIIESKSVDEPVV